MAVDYSICRLFIKIRITIRYIPEESSSLPSGTTSFDTILVLVFLRNVVLKLEFFNLSYSEYFLKPQDHKDGSINTLLTL